MKNRFLFALMLLMTGMGAIACSGLPHNLSPRDKGNDSSPEGMDGTETSSGPGQQLDLTDFNSIQCSGAADVFFTQAADYAAVAEDPGQMLKRCEVKDNNLIIETKKNKGSVKKPRIFLWAPTLQQLSVSGVCTFTTEDLRADQLTFNLSGVSNVRFRNLSCTELISHESGVCKVQGHIEGKRVELRCSGVSKDSLDIASDDLRLNTSGSSKLQIIFKGSNVTVDNSGSTKVDMNVDCQQLTVSNSGVSKVTVSGTARNKTINNSGAARVDTSRLK